MNPTETLQNLPEFEDLSPEELFRWARSEYGDRAGIITSFQKTGCAMIELMMQSVPGMRVITVDTLRLHEETYGFIEQVEAHYGIRVERFEPDPERVAKMVGQHGEYLFFDSREKQEFCCSVRKVDPNQRALDSLDVWFTGLRRDQSNFRINVPKVSAIEQDGRPLIKVAPLADWTEEQLDRFMAENSVPVHPLYAQGYESIGCVICTTPIQPGEPRRAGRWRWFNHMEDGHKKECGLHTQGSGI